MMKPVWCEGYLKGKTKRQMAVKNKRSLCLEELCGNGRVMDGSSSRIDKAIFFGVKKQ